ncbi:putative peptidoglycan-binding domain-containing protein [Clostridium pasteurianum DSM 525 = ATCC 6013]|uniref:N-acetylmuramoyl-L-alanine amidase family 2 n=1 Tax=Clostridium pasteurianum DSM 525 = ATCC 6013 TaxID=1262449 RepID=A0A0H3J7D3_CLOPA|nr:N-acetylmuramoyl-L-alanine amidase [Clostridium pasteurianum]AJA46890.1 putative peptidoglycan-binding domain-containing protein [Clostridium pasteurianum DSM 525 = ATCC 6013]AJA50878.1 putative peptidoglycan-binding domain-containing protein [Clostridium pasteurianum DSM 525 = ATCC 6013]AOZ74273.1 N-acetylmuramoyl-L-alanine amidase [Clostridium pasteurianum DSM 525 = ATCC 6013]AOZ78071.1 N-acetylmuramoyl-L-alanine amidase [Clostridium pasteurianum]ELP58139.1 N-acetylmuramoyl-L-alanine amid
MNILNGNLKFKNLSLYANNPKSILIHHAAAKHCSIQDIHHWHLEKGWAGCGYHYLVRKDGSIYSGRPETSMGAHCINYNSTSISICSEGNFNNESMENKQYSALLELTAFLIKKYNIDKIYGHSELNLTDCPGRNFPLKNMKTDLAVKKSSQNAANSQIQPIPYPGYLMKMNPKLIDENVRLFQKKLIYKNYNLGKWGADGYFGKYTFEAVIAFQRNNELLADGIVGINTWNRLFSN